MFVIVPVYCSERGSPSVDVKLRATTMLPKVEIFQLNATVSLRDPLILQYVNGICSVLRPFRTNSIMPQRWWRDPNIGPIQRFMFVIAPPEDPTCAAGITCSARHRETVSRGQRSPLDLGRRYLTVSFV